MRYYEEMLNPKILSMGILSICISIFTITWANAAENDTTEKALRLITDTADKICNTIPLEGEHRTLMLHGTAKAELNGLLKKLTDLGIQGSANYSSEEYTNVLQADLAKALQDNTNCKLTVFTSLQKKLIPNSSPNQSPPCDDLVRANDIRNGPGQIPSPTIFKDLSNDELKKLVQAKAKELRDFQSQYNLDLKSAVVTSKDNDAAIERKRKESQSIKNKWTKKFQSTLHRASYSLYEELLFRRHMMWPVCSKSGLSIDAHHALYGGLLRVENPLSDLANYLEMLASGL
jgi:hypothetical protein